MEHDRKLHLLFRGMPPFFSSPGALNPNSRQMGFVPHCTKAVDDVLFVTLDIPYGFDWNTVYRCIHIPSLVISTQLQGGSLSLTKNAFDRLLPKCIMDSSSAGSRFPVQPTIYSISACPPTCPRYCFIVKCILEQSRGVLWGFLEVEIDLSIPGPIKIFSRISHQYSVHLKTSPLHDSDHDSLLCLPLGRRAQLHASPSLRFLRVGMPDEGREARLRGVDKMHLCGLCVDRDAGHVILWAAEDGPLPTRQCGYICWLDERKAGDMVYSRTKELISSWSRGLLRRF